MPDINIAEGSMALYSNENSNRNKPRRFRLPHLPDFLKLNRYPGEWESTGRIYGLATFGLLAIYSGDIIRDVSDYAASISPELAGLARVLTGMVMLFGPIYCFELIGKAVDNKLKKE